MTVKPRPIKLVLESEEQKIQVLRRAKKLESGQGRKMGSNIHSPGSNPQTTGRKEATSPGNERKDNQRGKGSDDFQRENHQEKVKGRGQLKCFYTNANSLIQKIDELRKLASAYEYDVIAVTENWTYTGINNAELAIEGFNMYRVDRKGSRGGGVLLYVNDTFTSRIIEKLNSQGCEDSVWCTVRMGRLRLLIAVCYRSPSSSKENNSTLLAILERAVNEGGHDRDLIMGDFNYREIDYTNYEVAADETSEAYKFFSKTLDLYLFQNLYWINNNNNNNKPTISNAP